jgi:hypothetical protein
MAFLIIQTYLGYKTKIYKIFGFGPKLMEIGQFFRLFHCLEYSPYKQRALYKIKITIKKFVICSS